MGTVLRPAAGVLQRNRSRKEGRSLVAWRWHWASGHTVGLGAAGLLTATCTNRDRPTRDNTTLKRRTADAHNEVCQLELPVHSLGYHH